jgi:hypothetical protein
MYEYDAVPIYIDFPIVTGGIGLNFYSFIHFPVGSQLEHMAPFVVS